MHTLSKLLNIRGSEWPRLLMLYAMAFIFVLGIILGATVVEAAFLEQVGVEFLPWLFVARALVSVPAVALYSAFADRVANSRLLIAILLIGALGVTSGLVLLLFGLVGIAYPLLFLIRFVPLMEVFAAHWYTYVNGFYDTRAAKRIIPVLETAGIIASAVAGASVAPLARLLSADGVIGLWLACLVLMLLMVWFLPRMLKIERFVDTRATSTAGEGQQPSYLENIREGFRYTLNSSFLRWLALLTLVMVLLLTLLQFRTSQILLAELQTTEAIASFLGMVILVSNLLVLPIQLFLLSRMIGRIGLGNATLIYPGGMLAICASLIALPGTPTAALAFFARNEFYFSSGYPLTTLLYNAIPVRMKGRARGFVNGLVIPLGGLLAGLLLLTPLPAMVWLLSACIGVLAVAYLVIALVVRSQYSRALIRLLEEDMSSLLAQPDTPLQVTDQATLQVLKNRLEQSSTPEFTLFMAQFIGQVAGNEAVPILAELAGNTEDPHLRAAVLDILVASDIRSDAVRQLFARFLSDPDPAVRQAAINGLEHLDGPQDKQFLALALQMVDDPVLDVRVRVLSVLAQSGSIATWPVALAALEQLLSSDDAQQRASGVGVFSALQERQTVRRLLDYLADPADAVRLRAAVGLETLAEQGLLEEPDSAMLDSIRRMAGDPVGRVRQAALQLLGRTGTPELRPLLVQKLTDPVPQVRETAVEMLVTLGKAAVPLLHSELNATDLQRRKMAAVILARVNPGQFAPLLNASILTGNLIAIYRNYGLLHALSPLQGYTAGLLLQSALRERNQSLIDDILFLLGAVHQPDTIQVIITSLSSEEPHVRANATEALEALTTPQTTSLIAPLFDPTLKLAQRLAVAELAWDMPRPDAITAFRQVLQDAEDWLRALATFAAGEVGAQLVASASANASGADAAAEPLRSDDSALDQQLADLVPGRSRKRGHGRRTAPRSGTRPESVHSQLPLTLAEIEQVIQMAFDDPAVDVRRAARSATQKIAGLSTGDVFDEEGIMLSTIERIIFLKEVPFFQGMTVEQLKVLATVCDEERFSQDTRIINQGDPGGTLYVIISGKVGIEQEKRVGSSARLATLGVRSYFGESNLFNNTPHTAAAIALEDTFALRLSREPLIALARQNPELSLELIQVLSQRLSEANNRIAELTRVRPRELHKLFDQFD